MYQCLKKNAYEDSDGYQLLPVRQEDIEDIRLWRNAQVDVLRQSGLITAEQQHHYFQEKVWPLFSQMHPSQVLFSFLKDGLCIGYGGLTHLDWNAKRGEVSFLLDPGRIENRRSAKADFLHFLRFLANVAFDDLKLHRLVAETYAFRDETIETLEEFGFIKEGVLREHVFKRNAWTDSVMLGILANEAPSTGGGKRTSVLATSISKKMPLIQAVREAAKRSKLIDSIFGCDSDSDCIARYGVDHFWHCPPLEKLKLEELIAFCHAHGISCIIPTRDADLKFFSAHSVQLRKEGIYPMVSSAETIEVCLDKKAFSEVLLSRGFPAIPTECTLDKLSAPSYVVKERVGAGAVGIGLDLKRDQALEHASRLENPVFQPYIQGKEWSIDLYRTFAGEIKGCVARQRNLIVSGESQITTTKHNAILEDLCCRMAEQLDVRGHALFQVIEKDFGGFSVIECNPRFGGASTASLAVGLDSFYWFFLEQSGSSLQNAPFIRSKKDVRLVRYPADQVMPWSSSSI